MKQLLLWSFLLILSIHCFAQHRFEFGLTAEGSWQMKKELVLNTANLNSKSNWGTGIGTYISIPIWWRFSANAGLGYRYAEIQKGIPVYEDSPTDIFKYLARYRWITFSRHYILSPVCIELRITQNMFVLGGAEVNWLLNYNRIDVKPEFNRVIGIGSKKHKINWSLLYIKGTEEQLMVNLDSNRESVDGWVHYRTNMLQLKLSYPLWQKK